MAEFFNSLAYFRWNIAEILESLKKLTSSKTELLGIEAILKSSIVPDSAETGKELLEGILSPRGMNASIPSPVRKPMLKPSCVATRKKNSQFSPFAAPS